MSLIDKISNKMEQFVDELSKKYDDVDEELDDELDNEDLDDDDDDEELDDELEDDELDEDDEDEVVEPGNDKQNEQVKHNAENAINKNLVNESVRPEASIASIKASGDKAEDKKIVRENRNTSSKPLRVPSNETKEFVNKRGMLYDERLEALIDMALADGVLTEKEKQVLFKQAKEQGIDLDEFEMVLDAKMVSAKKDNKESLKEDKTEEKNDSLKKNKYGDIRKCPACGELIDGIMIKCPACGYRFVGIGVNNFVEEFIGKLNSAIIGAENKNFLRKIFVLSDVEGTGTGFIADNEEIRFLQKAPLPTTIEDSVAMLDFCLSQIINKSNGKVVAQWRIYYKNILKRLEKYSRGDKKLTELLAQYKKDYNEAKAKSFFLVGKDKFGKTMRIILLCFGVIIGVIYVIPFAFSLLNELLKYVLFLLNILSEWLH